MRRYAAIAKLSRFAKLAAMGYDKWQIRNDPVYQALIAAAYRR